MWGPLAAYLIGFHLLPVPDSIDLFLWIGLLLAALQLFFKKARVLLLMALFLWLGLFRSTGGSEGKDQLQPRAEVVLLQLKELAEDWPDRGSKCMVSCWTEEGQMGRILLYLNGDFQNQLHIVAGFQGWHQLVGQDFRH